MNTKANLLNLLENFESVSTDLSEAWTQACFETSFSDFDSFCQAIQFSILCSPEFPNHLSEFGSALLLYNQKSDSDEIWQEFTERNVPAQKLVVLFWFLMERGLKTNSAFDEQRLGLIGCRAYMSLCSLNAAQAYCLFNQFLFQKSLDMMRLYYRHLTSGKALSTCKSKKKAIKQCKTKTRGKNIAEENETTQQTLVEISPEDLAEMKEILFDATDSLYVMLTKVSLLSYNELTTSVIDLLGDLLQTDFKDDLFMKRCHRLSEFQQLKHISERIFSLMYIMCDERQERAKIVLSRFAMPRLLFWTFENTVLPTNAHPTKVMNDFKNTMLRFLKLLLEENKQNEMILVLLQNLCFRCPDRQDYKQKVSSVVFEILSMMCEVYIRKFINFLWILSSQPKVSARGFVIELALLILLNIEFTASFEIKQEEFNADVNMDGGSDGQASNIENVAAQRNEILNAKEDTMKDPKDTLLTIIVRACRDKAPSVRSKAILQVSKLLTTNTCFEKISKICDEMVSSDAESEHDENCDERTSSNLVNLLLDECADARVTCRKAALVALEVLFPYMDEKTARSILQCFKERCKDKSIVVRKQSAESMNNLLLKMSKMSNLLDIAWLNSVLPLVSDHEQSVSQFASKLVIDSLILPLIEEAETAAWRILELVEQTVDFRRSLLKAITIQENEKYLPASIVRELLKQSENFSKRNIVWMLLKDLCNFHKVNAQSAIDVWLNIDENDNLISYVANVLEKSAEQLNASQRSLLIDDFHRKLTTFVVDPRHISTVYYTLLRFMRDFSSDCEEANDEKFLAFNKCFASACCERLYKSVYHPSDRTSNLVGALDENTNSVHLQVELLARIITSLGESVLYDSSLITNKMFSILKVMLSSDYVQQEMAQSGMPISITPCVTEIHKQNTVGSQSQVGNKFSQGTTADLPGSQLGPTFLQQYSVNFAIFTPRVRALTVLTLGKMCLSSEKLAKKCIPVFARQLSINPDHIVRSNILCVMRDLYIRYALLVDGYIDIMVSCLKDSSLLVRKQALTLFTGLLNDNFIRWEGQIMYHFVLTLLDENSEIREYAKVCLVDVLLVQFPMMFLNHFLECLFYFNSVLHSARTISDQVNEDLSNRRETECALSNPQNKKSRWCLYQFMLKTFNDQEKFTIMARICQEIFREVVCGSLNVKEENVANLLEDCYEIMFSKEIKLSLNLGQRGPNANEEDDDEPPAAVQEEAKKVVSQAFRKGIIEAILPNIIELKYFLQENHLADLERGILKVLRELCKDHGGQLKDFLASDRLLAAEIQFDLRRLEEVEEREKTKRRATEAIAENVATDVLTKQTLLATSSRQVQVDKEDALIENDVAVNDQENDIGGSELNPRRTRVLPLERTAIDDHQSGDVSPKARLLPSDEMIPIVQDMVRVPLVLDEINQSVQPTATTSKDEAMRLKDLDREREKLDEQSPSSDINAQRKRVRHRTPSPNDDCIEPRAVSTPEHTIAELTFRLADVSMIKKPPKSKGNGSKFKKRKVKTIEEEEEEGED